MRTAGFPGGILSQQAGLVRVLALGATLSSYSMSFVSAATLAQPALVTPGRAKDRRAATSW